jgi:hypothetical protein
LIFCRHIKLKLLQEPHVVVAKAAVETVQHDFHFVHLIDLTRLTQFSKTESWSAGFSPLHR